MYFLLLDIVPQNMYIMNLYTCTYVLCIIFGYCTSEHVHQELVHLYLCTVYTFWYCTSEFVHQELVHEEIVHVMFFS